MDGSVDSDGDIEGLFVGWMLTEGRMEGRLLGKRLGMKEGPSEGFALRDGGIDGALISVGGKLLVGTSLGTMLSVGS